MQTRWHSAVESVTQVAYGFILSYFAGWIIYPLLGMQVSRALNFQITCAFTVVSLIRQFVIRRWFNKKASTADTVTISRTKYNELKRLAYYTLYK